MKKRVLSIFTQLLEAKINLKAFLKTLFIMQVFYLLAV